MKSTYTPVGLPHRVTSLTSSQQGAAVGSSLATVHPEQKIPSQEA